MPDIDKCDDAKNALNIAKHGVSFALAQGMFGGPVVTAPDDRKDTGEVREVSIGVVDGITVLTVVHPARRCQRADRRGPWHCMAPASPYVKGIH